MASLENSLGIKSTYFLQIDAETYNILEKETFESIKCIQSFGHAIGFHFNASRFCNLPKNEFIRKCNEQKMLLSKMLNLEISDVVSLHATG